MVAQPLGVHESTGLQVFDESDVAWYKPDILAAIRQGEPRFLRRANIVVPRNRPGTLRGISLPAFLVLADAALTTAANAMGAEVVDHEWGLAKLGPWSPFRQRQEFTPNGYRLIASVANIVDARPLPPQEAREVNALIADFVRTPHEDGYYASDISAGQCVVSGLTRILIDTEPILASDPV